MTAPPADPRRDTLIDYPCAFPIKVMGARQDGFVHAMTELARQHDPGFDAATVELREAAAASTWASPSPSPPPAASSSTTCTAPSAATRWSRWFSSQKRLQRPSGERQQL